MKKISPELGEFWNEISSMLCFPEWRKRDLKMDRSEERERELERGQSSFWFLWLMITVTVYHDGRTNERTDGVVNTTNPFVWERVGETSSLSLSSLIQCCVRVVYVRVYWRCCDNSSANISPNDRNSLINKDSGCRYVMWISGVKNEHFVKWIPIKKCHFNLNLYYYWGLCNYSEHHPTSVRLLSLSRLWTSATRHICLLLFCLVLCCQVNLSTCLYMLRYFHRRKVRALPSAIEDNEPSQKEKKPKNWDNNLLPIWNTDLLNS